MTSSSRYIDPFAYPIVNLRLRPTFHRLFWPSKASSTIGTDEERLTLTGRNLRARRRRRGEDVETREERLADASDEEREVGR